MGDEDKLYKAEYAKSGRASCKKCKDNIAKDSLRMAIMVQVTLARSHTGRVGSYFPLVITQQHRWVGVGAVCSPVSFRHGFDCLFVCLFVFMEGAAVSHLNS